MQDTESNPETPKKPNRDWFDKATLTVAILGTIAVAASAGVGAWTAIIMSGQLSEMRSSGQDTKNLVLATRNLANAAHDQATHMAKLQTATQDFAAGMKRQADSTASLVTQTGNAAASAADSAKAASSQAETAKREASALERSATAGRPYIFVEIMEPTLSACGNDNLLEGGRRSTACVKFRLTNYGDSPAVVTDIQSHIYVLDTNVPHVSGAKPQVYREKIANPAIFTEPQGGIVFVGGSRDFVPSPKGSDSLVVPAKATEEGNQILVFYDLPTTTQTSIDRDIWFWMVIRYRDIYGCNRWTYHVSPLWGGPTIAKTRYDYVDTDVCDRSNIMKRLPAQPTIPIVVFPEPKIPDCNPRRKISDFKTADAFAAYIRRACARHPRKHH